MSNRDESDEAECWLCGLLRSSCVCDEYFKTPTAEQLERQRRDRLTQAERAGELCE